jgi:hypothetical protein
MRFMGQIVLDPALFGKTIGAMAYIFVTYYQAEGAFVDNDWEADSGENAVIVQPGHNVAWTEPLKRGPTLRRYASARPGAGELESCEFALSLRAGVETEYNPRFPGLDEGDMSYLDGFVLADKIGGSPHFIQGTEVPGGSGWRLLAQFGSTPCELPFGGGWAFAFISEDGDSGKMVWQR